MHLPPVQSTSMESFLHGKHSTHCPQDLWPFKSLQSIHTRHVVNKSHSLHTYTTGTQTSIKTFTRYPVIYMTTCLITTQYFPDIVVCMWKLWLCKYKVTILYASYPNCLNKFHSMVILCIEMHVLSISCLILQHFSC